MTVDQLRELLEGIEDTREIVVHGEPEPCSDELFAVWLEAREQSNDAYSRWRRYKTRESYSNYRAAEDRADAAQDALCVRYASEWLTGLVT